MVQSMKTKLYSLKQSAERLNISTNQFHYLIKQLDVEPYLRAGDKHAAVLYSDEQVKELELALQLKENKYTYPIIKEVLHKIKENKDLWIINIENTKQFKVCTVDEVPQVISEIVKRGKKFIGGKIIVNKSDKYDRTSKSRELQIA